MQRTLKFYVHELDSGDTHDEILTTATKLVVALLSHWHWDHLGDPSTFPPSTELVVGPGFKKEFMPGFPANADSPVRESDFA